MIRGQNIILKNIKDEDKFKLRIFFASLSFCDTYFQQIFSYKRINKRILNNCKVLLLFFCDRKYIIITIYIILIYIFIYIYHCILCIYMTKGACHVTRFSSIPIKVALCHIMCLYLI